jgi:anti-sigma regulatory factor (Ser/Thr protein kinase)
MEQSAHFSLQIPARYRNLVVVTQCIDLLLADLPDLTEQEQIIYGIKLAVHEVANNVIRHAYGHEQGVMGITLAFEEASRRFTATLYDKGTAFDPAQAPTPDLDVPQESGYGLFLAEQLLDEVNYQRQADGNHWRLIKHLS